MQYISGQSQIIFRKEKKSKIFYVQQFLLHATSYVLVNLKNKIKVNNHSELLKPFLKRVLKEKLKCLNGQMY